MNSNLLDNLASALQAIGWVFSPFLVLPLLSLLWPKLAMLSRFQHALINVIDSVNMGVGEWAKHLLAPMVVCVAFGVFALSIFGQSWTKLDEISIYFHASIILLGSGATLLASQHVRVDIFHTHFSSKTKAFVDIIGFYALLTPFCLLIIWNAQGFIHLAWASLEGSAESDGIRGIYILKTLVSVFAVTLLLQGLSISGRAALLLTGKPLPPLPRHIDPLFSPQERESGL